MEDVIVLAVVGMPATGKSEVIKKLKNKFDFHHLYYGDITFDEVKRRGLELNETNERLVREDFRASGDLGIYSKFILPKIQTAIQNGVKRILLESMYNVYEYEIIRDAFPENFKVLAIHSDANVRLQRIGSRTDRKLSFEELNSRQISEAKKLGKGAVISLADYHYVNNGENMEVFNEDIKLLLNKIGITSDKKNPGKNFNDWNEVKKQTEFKSRMAAKPGQVVWCRLGENIGVEEIGKGNKFARPVIILKKFSSEAFLVAPLTSKLKEGDWYFNFNDKFGNPVSVILNQVKTIDAKRLENSLYQVKPETLSDIRKALKNLL